MSDPNIVLSAWQMTLMIAVPVVLLFGWLIAVFIAAGPSVAPGMAASASPAETAAIPAEAATFPAETSAPDQPDVPAPLAA
jgi:hypothetical protein